MNDPASKRSIYGHIAHGAAWSIAMRWGVRCIGLLSTVILARLLVPGDFGIVAMAALTYGILDTFFEIGIDLYLIRTQNLSREDWDTAWTLQGIQGILLAILLLAGSPFAASYFGEPRVEEVIRWLALVAVLRGFANIGIVKFRKELDFAADFRFGVYARMAGFFITIPAAFILQNYWALVIGQVAGAIIRFLLSYIMHPYRPRPCLARTRSMLSFSVAIMLISVSRFMHRKIDIVVVGGIADSTRLGQYTIASEFSEMVTAEAVLPVNRALTPNYSKIIHDPVQFSPVFLHCLSAVAILCFALGVGLSSVAEDFVILILGEKWVSAIPLIEWLALYQLANAMTNSISTALPLIPGGERQAVMLGFLRLAVVGPPVIIAGQLWDVQGIAMTATFSAFLFFPVVIFTVARVLPVTAMQIYGALWRPALAAAFMAWIVRLVDIEDVPVILSLATDVTVGACSYVAALTALWVLAGRPAGPERVALSFLAAQARRRLGR